MGFPIALWKPSGLSPCCYVFLQNSIILFSLKRIALPKAEISRLRAASAASIVSAKGRSFRLTRSAFLCRHWRQKPHSPKGFPIALWKPSGLFPCCYVFIAEQYKNMI